jgi:hypothetical protein
LPAGQRLAAQLHVRPAGCERRVRRTCSGCCRRAIERLAGLALRRAAGEGAGNRYSRPGFRGAMCPGAAARLRPAKKPAKKQAPCSAGQRQEDRGAESRSWQCAI